VMNPDRVYSSVSFFTPRLVTGFVADTADDRLDGATHPNAKSLE